MISQCWGCVYIKAKHSLIRTMPQTILKSIFALTTQASAISCSHFSLSNVFSVTSATIRLWLFTVPLLKGISTTVVHISIFSFSLTCQYPSLLNSPPLSLKNRLGRPKYDNLTKNVAGNFFTSYSLFSPAAEYLVDISIKCRIQYWLCLYFIKSKHTVSLKLFLRGNPSTGLRGFLNRRQTEQESQTSRIRSRNSLSLSVLLPLTKDINFSFDVWANCLYNFSAFLLFSALEYF